MKDRGGRGERAGGRWGRESVGGVEGKGATTEAFRKGAEESAGNGVGQLMQVMAGASCGRRCCRFLRGDDERDYTSHQLQSPIGHHASADLLISAKLALVSASRAACSNLWPPLWAPPPGVCLALCGLEHRGATARPGPARGCHCGCNPARAAPVCMAPGPVSIFARVPWW